MAKRNPFLDPPSKSSALISETNWRKKHVVPALAVLHAKPVENTVGPGMPDVAYIGGWIELKCIDVLPRRAEDPVKCAHFRPDQRGWLVEHDAKGGRCHVMILFPKTWDFMLLGGAWAAKRLGFAPMQELQEYAHWFGPWNPQDCLRLFWRG